MPKNLVITFFVVAWVVLTILALTWGFVFDWPDYVHVNYGFPLVWATHTLNTIAGPVDKWRVDISVLLLDLLFWQGLMGITVTMVLHIFNRKA